MKEAEWNAETDPVKKAKAAAEVTKAKLATNKAALKAGVALPYPEHYLAQ